MKKLIVLLLITVAINAKAQRHKLFVEADVKVGTFMEYNMKQIFPDSKILRIGIGKQLEDVNYGIFLTKSFIGSSENEEIKLEEYSLGLSRTKNFEYGYARIGVAGNLTEIKSEPYKGFTIETSLGCAFGKKQRIRFGLGLNLISIFGEGVEVRNIVLNKNITTLQLCFELGITI